jgi:hypothetical protein
MRFTRTHKTDQKYLHKIEPFSGAQIGKEKINVDAKVGHSIFQRLPDWDFFLRFCCLKDELFKCYPCNIHSGNKQVRRGAFISNDTLNIHHMPHDGIFSVMPMPPRICRASRAVSAAAARAFRCH